MPDYTDISASNTSSRQIDDLIGVTPNWLMQSGISIVALVFMVILTISAFIKYPDKIVAKGVMTSENPPIEHINQTAGIIEEIFTKTGDIVGQGEPLVLIKNNVKRRDLAKIKSFIEDYKSIKHIPNYLQLEYPKNLELGDLQSNYSQLQLAFSQFQLTQKQSGVFQQIETIKNEIHNTKELREVLLLEKDYSQEEMALIERDFGRNIVLNNEGVISDLDKEKVEGEWLRYQKQYSNLNQGIIQNKIREEQLILEIQKLSEARASTVQTQRHGIAQHINLLESAIEKWHKEYFICAEITGEVVLSPNLNKDKYFNESTVLCSVIPSEKGNKKLIKVQTSSAGIGKINIEDKVIVKVDGYPYKEFGTITSEVREMSPLPVITQTTDGINRYTYSISIGLPDTLVTSHHKELPYHPNSSVTAEIITEDKTILERLLETFLSLLKSE